MPVFSQEAARDYRSQLKMFSRLGVKPKEMLPEDRAFYREEMKQCASETWKLGPKGSAESAREMTGLSEAAFSVLAGPDEAFTPPIDWVEVPIGDEAQADEKPEEPLRIPENYAMREDLVMVAEFGQPDRTPGGIYVPDRYKATEWRFGRVMSAGPGKRTKNGVRSPMPLKSGDNVLFSRRFGTQMKKGEDGITMRVLSLTQILCKVEDFEPWWNVQECQSSPGTVNSG
jgi:chaperonin GroES